MYRTFKLISNELTNRLSFELSFIVRIVVCLFFSTLVRGKGRGLRSQKHVSPRRIFAPVPSQEPLAFVSFV